MFCKAQLVQTFLIYEILVTNWTSWFFMTVFLSLVLLQFSIGILDFLAYFITAYEPFRVWQAALWLGFPGT